MITKISKPLYSEDEAARELGVSVEQLRSMVKNHIVKDDEASEGAVTTFQASDLLLLKILSRAANSSVA